MTECKECGTPVEEDELFCPNCGVAQADKPAISNIEQGTSNDEVEKEGDPVSRIPHPEPPLLARWNTARKFVENTTLSFNLRLTPDVEFQGLELLIRGDFDSMGPVYKKVGRCPAGLEQRINLPFKPPAGSAGEIPFDVFLRFEKEGVVHTLCATQTHSIYKEEQAPQAVHYHSETKVETGSGHANDHNIHVNGAAMPDLSKKEKKALWEEINAQENWEPIDLQETSEFPKDELPQKSAKDAKKEKATLAEESDREKARKKREKVVWIAVGVVALLAVLHFMKQEAPPVQVNVVQQSGSGAHVAQLSVDAESSRPEVAKVKPTVVPVVSESLLSDGDLNVRFELLGGKTRFVEGEKLQYRIRSDRDCYVALLCYQSDGSTVLLFPNLWHSDSFIRGGQSYKVPEVGSGFDIVVTPPFGQDTVELIACTGRSEFHRMLGAKASATTRGMPFVFEAAHGALTRGMSTVPTQGASPEWHRETMTVTTKAK